MIKKILGAAFKMRWLQKIAMANPMTHIIKKHFVDHDLSEENIRNCIKHGIRLDTISVYDIDKWDIGLYVTERDLEKIDLGNQGLAPAFFDKRNHPLLFQNKAHYLPSLNIATDKGRIQYIMEAGAYQEGEFDLEQTLERYIKKYSKLIVKPHSLFEGIGIFTITDRLTEEDLQKIHKEGNVVINNFLINEEYAYRISPSSLNTIRVTFYKTRDGTLNPIGMFHRFGGAAGSFVDNVSGGGVAVNIDHETGEMLQAFTIDRKRINLEVHPVTEQKITGYTIPDWNSKKKQIDDLLNEINYLDFGGLDVAFTTEGIKMIEVNTKFPALRSMQATSPALLDDGFVDFLKRRGFDREIPNKPIKV